MDCVLFYFIILFVSHSIFENSMGLVTLTLVLLITITKYPENIRNVKSWKICKYNILLFFQDSRSELIAILLS